MKRVFKLRELKLQAVGLVPFVLVGLDLVVREGSTGERIFGAILATTCALFTYRLLRLGTVIADDDALVVRRVFRAYRAPYERIRHITAENRSAGVMRGRQSILVIEEADGRRRAITDFHSRPGKDGRPSTVEVIAEQVDAVVEEHRQIGSRTGE